MRLDIVQRLILANQYRILGKLSGASSETKPYQYYAEILENGYESLYHHFLDSIEQIEIAREESTEVFNILKMFESLGDSYDNLTDKSGLAKHKIEFAGFDGNGDEAKYNQFILFNCNNRGDQNWFPSVFRRSPKWHSHNFVRLVSYQAMLKKWWSLTGNGMSGTDTLSKEQIEEILACGRESSARKLRVTGKRSTRRT